MEEGHGTWHVSLLGVLEHEPAGRGCGTLQMHSKPAEENVSRHQDSCEFQQDLVKTSWFLTRETESLLYKAAVFGLGNWDFLVFLIIVF